MYREKAWPQLNGLGDGFLTSDGSTSPDLATTITSLAMPIDQALAYKIAGTTPLVADFQFGNLFSPTGAAPTIGGIPWWGIALVAIGAIWVLNRR